LRKKVLIRRAMDMNVSIRKTIVTVKSNGNKRPWYCIEIDTWWVAWLTELVEEESDVETGKKKT